MIDSTNSSTSVPTDAELRQMVYGNKYHIPASQEVQQHARNIQNSPRVAGEHDADFARWEEELTTGEKFVLGQDVIDPNLFDDNQPAVEHGRVTSVDTNGAASEAHHTEDSVRETIEHMSPEAQVQLIGDTSRYLVPHVRLTTVEESRR